VTNVQRVEQTDSSSAGLVSQIIAILTPTIRSSVAQALAGRRVSQQSFTSNYQTNTQTFDRESLAMKVLDALEPTIAAQVSTAIENMRQTQIATLTRKHAVSESQVESLVQQIIVSLTPNIRSAVRGALETQAQAHVNLLASETTQFDQAALVRQIIKLLRPKVMNAFSEAIAAWEAAEQQKQVALREQQRQAALREQQRLEAERQAALLEQRQAALLEQQRQAALREQQRLEAERQAALLEQQRQAALLEQQRQAALRRQQRLEAERQAALLEQQRQAALLAAQQQQAASGDLSSLFGSGHEVLSVVPGQAKVEYQIGNPRYIG